MGTYEPVNQPVADNQQRTDVDHLQQPDNKTLAVEIPLNSPSVSKMFNESMLGFVEVALNTAKIPKTQENVQKVILNLTKKISQLMVSGDFLIEDVDSKEYGALFLEQACARRGLPNTANSWQKIIKELEL